ncbi:50S ribosomal protein L20 [uncultured Dubosiella sp.]|uniref:50S ribosomal protein L20 n=1 Tax=uncultured Dubosiella sp. TaxID=1937011 RepID=UPI000EE5F075|nr:50S ribosomal protein L20 [uncultured Dubosiella sp.]GJM58000.1 50S ribosomal protein L20 [Erysipelotrichaceae bacterium OPF54]HAM30016.1 50S ribosomal protein L20 [Erysipelotrichaceae bacterium]
MARVKGGTVSRARRKKVLKLAKGYFGSKHTLYKTANEQVMHSFKYAYNDRRKLKGNMRKIWITRINAAARMNDLSYSRLMHGLKLANIEINRKMLSEIAIHDAETFTKICDEAKAAIAKA